MALSTNDQMKIREYLLGQLSDEEQLKIEERLMLENELFEELEISKSELIEDYSSGELSEQERAWFEQHFLASAEGKQKYTFAIALNRLERPIPMPGELSKRSKIPSWATAAIISLVVLVVVGVALILYRGDGPPTFVSLELPMSSPTRGEGSQPPSLRVADVDQLRLSLILPPSAPAAKSFRAELLETNDTGDGRNVQILEHDSRRVSVMIPAKELPAGEYAVKLLAIKDDGTEQRITGNYFFNIE
jgi:hypothetical protein